MGVEVYWRGPSLAREGSAGRRHSGALDGGGIAAGVSLEVSSQPQQAWAPEHSVCQGLCRGWRWTSRAREEGCLREYSCGSLPCVQSECERPIFSPVSVSTLCACTCGLPRRGSDGLLHNWNSVDAPLGARVAPRYQSLAGQKLLCDPRALHMRETCSQHVSMT